jgi:hypothetical protein
VVIYCEFNQLLMTLISFNLSGLVMECYEVPICIQSVI